MRPIITSVFMAFSLLACFGTTVRAEDAETKQKNHLVNTIEIFGKSDLPAIYILMPGSADEEDIKGSIITRDFSRDPFFMQNIDREEFEMKVVLRELNGDEKDKDKEKLFEAKR